MFSVEKISVAYATPTPPASWRYCAPLSSLWCAAPATIHSKSPKRSSLMIPTKPSGYSVPDALSEWSVKFCTLVIAGPKFLEFYDDFCNHRATSLKADGKDILAVTIALNAEPDVAPPSPN